jgi:hypothetical protein
VQLRGSMLLFLLWLKSLSEVSSNNSIGRKTFGSTPFSSPNRMSSLSSLSTKSLSKCNSQGFRSSSNGQCRRYFDPDLFGRTAKLAAGGGRFLCVARRCFRILAGAERLFSPVVRCNALECHIPVWNRQQTHKCSLHRFHFQFHYV